MKSYHFRRAMVTALIAGQLLYANPAFSYAGGGNGIKKEIKRIKDNNNPDGIMVAGSTTKTESTIQKLQKELESLIQNVYENKYMGLPQDYNFLYKELDGNRGKWLENEGYKYLNKTHKEYYKEFKEKNYLGLRLLYYYANIEYKKEKNELITDNFLAQINKDIEDAKNRIPRQKEVKGTVPIPTEAENARKGFIGPVFVSRETKEELAEAKRNAEEYAKKLKEYLQNPYIDHKTNKPWTKYVGPVWVQEVERIYSAVSSVYAHYSRDEKDAVNEVFRKILGAPWVDEKAQKKIEKEIAQGKKITAANEMQGAVKQYIDNGKIAAAIYTNLINSLKTAAPGTEEALIRNAMQDMDGKLTGPVAKMFKIYMAYPWHFNYTTSKGMDTQSSTAMLDLMLNIANNEEFVKYKRDINTFLTNIQIAGKYDSGSVLSTFNGLPLETQYELMNFMKRNFGGINVPDSKRFAALVMGLGNMPPRSSPYFLQKHGDIVYYGFKVDDIENICRFVGSRMHARELSYDYENAKAYVDSLTNKFQFLLEWNAYKIRESRRERPKSVTISSPGGKELMDIFRASGSIDLNTILTLFEKNNPLAGKYTMIGGQPVSITEFINLYKKEDLESAKLVTDFFRAYEKIMGKIVHIGVNTPEGYVTVPTLGLDLYALEDTGPLLPGEWTYVNAGLGGSGTGTKEVSGTATEGTGFKEIKTRETSAMVWRFEGEVAGGGPGREAYAKAKGEMPGRVYGKESVKRTGDVYSEEVRVFENEDKRLEIEQKTHNVEFAGGQIIEQELNYNWDKRSDLSGEISAGPSVPGGIQSIENARTLEEKRLLNFWLDHNAKGATTAVRLKFDEQMLGEADHRRKFEVEVLRRQPSGTFISAGTFELTYDQAQQVYGFYRQVIESGKGEGYTSGKSVQVGYSHLLLFDKDIFDGRTVKGSFEGAEVITQLGKLGAGGAIESKLEGPKKGLGLATKEFGEGLVGAALFYINPEFKNLLAERRMLADSTVKQRQAKELAEPRIGALATATLDDLKRRAERGGAAEAIFIKSQQSYGSAFASVTDILRAGALVKYVNDNIMTGGGFYGEFKEGGAYAGSAYLSNRNQTIFALASLLGQQEYGWGADVAARYIGEQLGAKVITVYDKDMKAGKYQVFAGSELSYKGDGALDEVRLYYIAGAKVEKAANEIQHIVGANPLFGKVEAEIAGFPYGEILGTGIVNKLTLWNIFEISDFKLSTTGLFGKLEKGEVPGVEGTMWTGGIGTALQKGKFRLLLVPFSYVEEEGLGISSYETSAFGRYYLHSGWIDGYGGILWQSREKKKIPEALLTEAEKRLSMDLGIPLVDPTRDAWLASIGLSGGWKYLLFDENTINMLFKWGENPEMGIIGFTLTLKGINYRGHTLSLSGELNKITRYVGTNTTGESSKQTSGKGGEEIWWNLLILYTCNF